MSVSVLAPSFQSVPFILLSAFFTLDGSLSLLHCRSDNLRVDLDCDERPNGFFLTNVPDGEEVLEEYFSSGLYFTLFSLVVVSRSSTQLGYSFPRLETQLGYSVLPD